MDKELVNLKLAVTRFSKAMFNKLERKYVDGFIGWDREENTLNILAKLNEHCEKQFSNPTDENLVDIANLSMMLWNLRDKQTTKGEGR